MQIALTKDQVLHYASLYDESRYDDDIEKILAAAADRGFMDLVDLVAVARWKWKGGRTAQLVKGNSDDDVREITAVAFSTTTERLRIGALLSLAGVDWPMASVILHFAFPDHYPILDVRAMRSVGGSAIYNFDRWMNFVRICRDKREEYAVSMRTLDKALWGFDKHEA